MMGLAPAAPAAVSASRVHRLVGSFFFRTRRSPEMGDFHGCQSTPRISGTVRDRVKRWSNFRSKGPLPTIARYKKSPRPPGRAGVDSFRCVRNSVPVRSMRVPGP